MKRLAISAVFVAGFASLHGGEELPFHFQHDLAPYLARAGCAAADCHGGATGRGGFKLSLFATNARADYEAITQDRDGRRVDYLDPSRSLVLLKPTRQMKHKGGHVLEKDSDAYRALEAWIREGAPFAEGEPRELAALELNCHDDRLVATAEFTGANATTHPRDVTGLARFESTDERVVTVDKDGKISMQGPGEAWVIAHYGSRSARYPVVQSFGATVEVAALDDDRIGGAWFAKLDELGIAPAAPANDHRLLRRLYLDLAGRPPAPDEIARFLELPASHRVERTAQHLLASDEFAAQLARSLWQWFEVPPPDADLRHTNERNARLRDELRSFAARDESLLDFVASMFDDPRHREFVQRFEDPRDRAEFVGRAQLGMSIGCARCHNHPTDRWSQAQHLKFSALFAAARPRRENGAMVMAPGRFFLPGDGKPVEPALLPISLPAKPVPVGSDHTAHLAAYLRDDASRAFARNAANRVFGVLLGRHLVEAPDDHRLSNPALHEPLLAALEATFETHEHRLRPLVQRIVSSPIYAMDSTPPDSTTLSGDPQLRYLARREARAMSADEFLRAVRFVLGVEAPPVEAAGTPLAQQLQLLNSGLLQDWLRRPGNQVEALFTFEIDPQAQLEQLYLLILTRPPRDEDVESFLPVLESASDPLAAGRDLAFALLAGREFSSIR